MVYCTLLPSINKWLLPDHYFKVVFFYSFIDIIYCGHKYFLFPFFILGIKYGSPMTNLVRLFTSFPQFWQEMIVASRTPLDQDV